MQRIFHSWVGKCTGFSAERGGDGPSHDLSACDARPDVALGGSLHTAPRGTYSHSGDQKQCECKNRQQRSACCIVTHVCKEQIIFLRTFTVQP